MHPPSLAEINDQERRLALMKNKRQGLRLLELPTAIIVTQASRLILQSLKAEYRRRRITKAYDLVDWLKMQERLVRLSPEIWS